MLTGCAPAETPKAPLCATLTLTSRLAVGAGLALRVKLALSPSVMPLPAVILISGAAGVIEGGGMSSSATATVADLAAHDTR